MTIEPGAVAFYGAIRKQRFSTRGASSVVATTVDLPSPSYLNILGLAYRITCTETTRNGNRIHVRFINLIEPETLRRVVRADFMIGNAEALAARGRRR